MTEEIRTGDSSGAQEEMTREEAVEDASVSQPDATDNLDADERMDQD